MIMVGPQQSSKSGLWSLLVCGGLAEDAGSEGVGVYTRITRGFLHGLKLIALSHLELEGPSVPQKHELADRVGGYCETQRAPEAQFASLPIHFMK